MEPRIAVVGAGIAGLTAARALADAGRDVVVFEKARGPGGRTSTRRIPPFAFDHGAPFFTVRDPGFRAQVDAWLAAGVAAPWEGRLRGGPPRARYRGRPGMSALCGALATGLDVRPGVRVTDLRPPWTIAGERFDAVLVAAPAPQAAQLLRCAPALAARAASVALLPCWAVLLGFDAPFDPGFDAAFVEDSPLVWTSRGPAGEAWTLHAGPEWSRAHLDRPRDEVQDALARAFAEAAGRALPPPAYAAAHRWRYARVAEPLDEPCLWDPRLRLGACGDWCLGARVEAAHLSGLALAERVAG